MIKDLPIKEYHALEQVSSTVLKAAIKSSAHLDKLFTGGIKTSKAMILGDAVHAYILEGETRFADMYETVTETYQRKTGDHEAGEPKLDEDGEPIIYLRSKEDASLDIKGEEYKKFLAIQKAYNESTVAKDLVSQAEYIECSFITDKYKVRPDLITKDGWIVDLKSVGGEKDMPARPDCFCRDFYNFGYDIQMYLYYKLVQKELPDIKGFKFMCLEAKIPSGIQIYTFTPEDPWFKVGMLRTKLAINNLQKYKFEDKHKVYDDEDAFALPLSFEAQQLLREFSDD